MDVILGKTAGFCGGVKNSVDKASEILKEHKKVYCLGELVHNNTVINNLEEKGIIFVDNITDVPRGENVIFRAHGVTRDTYNIARDNELNVFDLTCPKVLKIHDQIDQYINDGYFVLLVGEAKHPEVVGSLSFTSGNGIVIENLDDLELKYDEYKNKDKIVLLSQTTYSVSKFEEINGKIKELAPDVLINNTICNATSLRQEETSRLSLDVDFMIIIGGKKSSNTQKLFSIAQENVDSVVIETVDDLDLDLSKYKKIGVMAGASTPKENIDEVLDYLNSL